MKLNLKEWMAKVSAWIAGADGRYVNTTGDTMTGGLTFKRSGIDTTQANNGVTSNSMFSYPMYRDVNDRYLGWTTNIAYPNGEIGTSIYASNFDSGGNRVENFLDVKVAKNGTRTFRVGDQAAFRTAIGAVNKAGDTMTGNLTVNGTVKANGTTIPASATLVKMSQQGWGTSLTFNCTKNHAIVLMSSQILLIWLAKTNDVNTLLVQGGATPAVKSGTSTVTNGNWKITRSGTNVTIAAVSGSATMTAFYV